MLVFFLHAICREYIGKVGRALLQAPPYVGSLKFIFSPSIPVCIDTYLYLFICGTFSINIASHTRVIASVCHMYGICSCKTTRAIRASTELYVHVGFGDFTIVLPLTKGYVTDLHHPYFLTRHSFSKGGAPEQKWGWTLISYYEPTFFISACPYMDDSSYVA
jgi:hypothetical protein